MSSEKSIIPTGKRMRMVSYKTNKDLNYLIELFKDGKLKLDIDNCFPLEKTAEAFRYFGEGISPV